MNQTARITLAGELTGLVIPTENEDGTPREDADIDADRGAFFTGVLNRWDATFADLANRLLEMTDGRPPVDEDGFEYNATLLDG